MKPPNRTVVVCTRVTEAEWADIQDAAARVGKRTSAFVRESVMEKAHQLQGLKPSVITVTAEQGAPLLVSTIG